LPALLPLATEGQRDKLATTEAQHAIEKSTRPQACKPVWAADLQALESGGQAAATPPPPGCCPSFNVTLTFNTKTPFSHCRPAPRGSCMVMNDGLIQLSRALLTCLLPFNRPATPAHQQKGSARFPVCALPGYAQVPVSTCPM
jgi:hypothetical protein